MLAAAPRAFSWADVSSTFLGRAPSLVAAFALSIFGAKPGLGAGGLDSSRSGTHWPTTENDFLTALD